MCGPCVRINGFFVCDTCEQVVCPWCERGRCPCPQKYEFGKDALRLIFKGSWESIDQNALSKALVEGDMLLFDGNTSLLDTIMHFDLLAGEVGEMSVNDFIGILVYAVQSGRTECVYKVLNLRIWGGRPWYIIRPAIVAIWKVCKNDERLKFWFNRGRIGSWKNGIGFKTILQRATAPRRITRSM